MGLQQAMAAPPGVGCLGGLRPADLTFLLHAATNRMVVELDRAAVEMGLSDARDWMVLAVLEDGQERTQLELSKVVCIDKTTLISVLDRLERQELIVRTVSPNDRRVRIPRLTEAGRRVHAKFASARDTAEARVLDGLDESKRSALLDLLVQIVGQPA